MIFTYWTGDPDAIVPFERAWKAFDADAQVYNDEQVHAALQALNPAYVGIYRRIRIPACKSDVARLALLYAHGGLYMDAHSVPNDIPALLNLTEEMKHWEVIIFDDPLDHQDEDDIQLHTSAFAARRGSPTLSRLIGLIMSNLHDHARAEAASSTKIDYNIFVLSGPWAIRLGLVTVTKPYVVHRCYRGRVLRKILARDRSARPFLWYVNYGYRRAGQHWSERQQVEPLFEAAP